MQASCNTGILVAAYWGCQLPAVASELAQHTLPACSPGSQVQASEPPQDDPALAGKKKTGRPAKRATPAKTSYAPDP